MDTINNPSAFLAESMRDAVLRRQRELVASLKGINLDWDTPIADAAKHRRISYEKRADAQRKAWVKRREKYGPRGRR